MRLSFSLSLSLSGFFLSQTLVRNWYLYILSFSSYYLLSDFHYNCSFLFFFSLFLHFSLFLFLLPTSCPSFVSVLSVFQGFCSQLYLVSPSFTLASSYLLFFAMIVSLIPLLPLPITFTYLLLFPTAYCFSLSLTGNFGT